MLAIVSVVAGDALLVVEDVVALDARLIDRIDLSAAGFQIVVRRHRPPCREQRRCSGVSMPLVWKTPSAFMRGRAEEALGNDVAGEDLAGDRAVRVGHLA